MSEENVEAFKRIRAAGTAAISKHARVHDPEFDWRGASPGRKARYRGLDGEGYFRRRTRPSNGGDLRSGARAGTSCWVGHLPGAAGGYPIDTEYGIAVVRDGLAVSGSHWGRSRGSPRSRRAVGVVLWTKAAALLCTEGAFPDTPPSPAWDSRAMRPQSPRFAPARTSATRVLLVYAVADDLGRALLRLARKAPLDGHVRQQRVLDEAVGLLLGLPHGGDEDASVCRPSGVVGLSFGQTSRRGVPPQCLPCTYPRLRPARNASTGMPCGLLLLVTRA